MLMMLTERRVADGVREMRLRRRLLGATRALRGGAGRVEIERIGADDYRVVVHAGGQVA